MCHTQVNKRKCFILSPAGRPTDSLEPDRKPVVPANISHLLDTDPLQEQLVRLHDDHRPQVLFVNLVLSICLHLLISGCLRCCVPGAAGMNARYKFLKYRYLENNRCRQKTFSMVTICPLARNCYKP